MSETTPAPESAPGEETPSEEKKEASFLGLVLSMTVYALLFVFFAGIAAASIGSAMGYYRLDTVLSGSMRPAYPEGSVVLAFAKPKEQVATGDVIIFRSPEQYGGETVTHRVISARLTETGDVYVRTKGDNNNAPDPWEARVTANEVWEVEQGIPYVGYVAYYAKQWWPLLIGIAVSLPMLGFANARVRETYGWKKRRFGRKAATA